MAYAQCEDCKSSKVDLCAVRDANPYEPPIVYSKCRACGSVSYYIGDDFSDKPMQYPDAYPWEGSDEVIDLDNSTSVFQDDFDDNVSQRDHDVVEPLEVSKSKTRILSGSSSRGNNYPKLDKNKNVDLDKRGMEVEEGFKIDGNGNSEDVGSKKMDEDMQKVINLILSQPCDECKSGELKRLAIEDCILFHCENCEYTGGLDDTMNYFEYVQFLEREILEEGDFQQAACKCGNSDPSKFKGHSVDVYNGVSRLRVKCDVCDEISDVNIIAGSNLNNNADGMIDKHVMSDSDCIVLDETNEDDVSNLSSCSTYDLEYSCAAARETTKVHAASDHTNTPSNVELLSRNNGGKIGGGGSSIGRTKINNLRRLKMGDHIAFHQVLGYWHHSLVIEVPYIEKPALKGFIQVIHYNGPVNPVDGGLFTKGVVVEEWIEVDTEKQELYRIDYSPNGCFAAGVAIANARTRLGEANYNILTNNCEHFVRKCKTGHHRSDQSSAFASTVKHYASMASVGLGRMLKSASSIGLTKNGVRVGGKALNVVLSETGAAAGQGVGRAVADAAVNEGKQVVAASSGKLAFAGLAVGMEVKSVCSDIMEAHRQRVAGNITRDEFVKITIKRSCEGGGSLAAMAVTIPLPHAWIGVPLAALVGRGVGCLLGRSVGAAWGKKWGKR